MSFLKANKIKSLKEEIERKNKIIIELSGKTGNSFDCNKKKVEYLSDVLHDIKTTLNVILGAIQLTEQINKESSDNKIIQDKHFQSIKKNSYRLLPLINSISDLEKMDAGYIKFNPSNCNIVSVVEDLVQSSSPYASHKGITLEFDTSDEEIMAWIDVEKFERIILNLLSNAIKFTPAKGKVKIHITYNDNKAYISVKDSGIGIPSCMQDKIFERFSQVSSSISSEFEGCGIGLSIVNFFTNLHKGKITLASEVGKGSEFTVEIPITQESLVSIDATPL